jgi:hypothetical protein
MGMNNRLCRAGIFAPEYTYLPRRASVAAETWRTKIPDDCAGISAHPPEFWRASECTARQQPLYSSDFYSFIRFDPTWHDLRNTTFAIRTNKG